VQEELGHCVKTLGLSDKHLAPTAFGSVVSNGGVGSVAGSVANGVACSGAEMATGDGSLAADTVLTQQQAKERLARDGVKFLRVLWCAHHGGC
jgi:hypothetical protein